MLFIDSILFTNRYCQSGLFNDALLLFEEMKNYNVEPDEMMLSTVLSACGRAGNLSYGKMIHDFIMENNIVVDPHLQSALVTMYASCGSMDLALNLFEKMTPKTLLLQLLWLLGIQNLDRLKMLAQFSIKWLKRTWSVGVL